MAAAYCKMIKARSADDSKNRCKRTLFFLSFFPSSLLECMPEYNNYITTLFRPVSPIRIIIVMRKVSSSGNKVLTCSHLHGVATKNHQRDSQEEHINIFPKCWWWYLLLCEWVLGMNRRRMKRTSRRTSSFKLLFPWTLDGRMDREEKSKQNSICCNLEYNHSSVASSPSVAATRNDNRDSVRDWNRFLQLLFHEDHQQQEYSARTQVSILLAKESCSCLPLDKCWQVNHGTIIPSGQWYE